MKKIKFNKKHLLTFTVTLLLLISFNLNVFADTSYVIDFGDLFYRCFAYDASDGNFIEFESTSVTRTTGLSDSVDGVDFSYCKFQFPISESTYNTAGAIHFPVVPELNLNSTYNIDFYARFWSSGEQLNNLNNRVQFLFTYYDKDALDNTGEYVLLHEDEVFVVEFSPSSGWVHVESSYTLPDLSGNVLVNCIITFHSYEINGGVPTFDISTMTFTATSSGSGGSGGSTGGSGDSGGSTGGNTGDSGSSDDNTESVTPIVTPSLDEFNGMVDDYYNTMDSLPTVDNGELKDLMDFDFDSFTDGMEFVRKMFNDTMTIFGFNSVLVFALTIGLATYFIGRKVG